jgi:hypothetical protein
MLTFVSDRSNRRYSESRPEIAFRIILRANQSTIPSATIAITTTPPIDAAAQSADVMRMVMKSAMARVRWTNRQSPLPLVCNATARSNTASNIGAVSRPVF